MSSREFVLGRIRAALADVPRGESPGDVPVAREYARAHVGDATIHALLVANLRDYRAVVHEVRADDVPDAVAGVLARRRARRVVVPPGLPSAWTTRVSGTELLADQPPLTAYQLDDVDGTLTTCAVAVAETGTIVLDAGPGMGRRALTLVPDHHLCVVPPDRVVASVPHALARLDPARPLTWISGPSATSDIELSRVEGVHGPRTLEVIVVVA